MAGVLLATGPLAAPRIAQAQTSEPSTAAQALLGSPAGTSRFVNLTVRSDLVAATQAERGLLGATGGLYVRLEPDTGRVRRSAGESALLGR